MQLFELYLPSASWNNNRSYLTNADLVTAIGDYMINLKYLHIDQLLDLSYWPNSLCNLNKTLTYLHFGFVGLTHINQCISSFNNLQFFYISGGLIGYVPNQLFH